MDEEQELEDRLSNLIGRLNENERFKENNFFARRSGILFGIQLILCLSCVALLAFGEYSPPNILFYVFSAGIYIFFISSILTIVLLKNSKTYLNPLNKKRLKSELDSMEYIRKCRNCYSCKKELSFLDYCSINVKRSLEELMVIWISSDIEIYCCFCYNRQNGIILKYKLYYYLLGLVFISLLLIGFGIVYKLTDLVFTGFFGVFGTIVLLIIIIFIDARKKDLQDKIEAYILIGVLTIIFFNILYISISSKLIPIYRVDSIFFIIIIFIYIIILIPFTIKFIYKTYKRRKEIKNIIKY